MTVTALIPARIVNLVAPLPHKGTDMHTTDTNLTIRSPLRYTAPVTSKKGVIGCESPMARGAEPHPARFAAFLFLNRLGGSNGRAQALPATLRVPRSLTPVRAAAQCESWSAVVHLAQLETNMIKHTTTPNEAACISLFGEHAEDVISPIKCAADALGWIEEILKTIQCEALKERNGHRIKQLAEAAAYLASDMSNYAIVRHETMIHRLRTAGVITTKE